MSCRRCKDWAKNGPEFCDDCELYAVRAERDRYKAALGAILELKVSETASWDIARVALNPDSVCPKDTCPDCYHKLDSEEHGKCAAERSNG